MRLLYFDTSFLVPLILVEATSEKIDAFVKGLAGETLCVSHWVRVEFSSVLARDVRMGRLEGGEAARADARFEGLVSRSFAVILPDPEDYDLAKRYLGLFETGLRAGDAMHLAIAGNHRARMIYSLDRGLVKAGGILGLPVSMGIQVDQ